MLANPELSYSSLLPSLIPKLPYDVFMMMELLSVKVHE